jgi:hypothetical protein
MIGLRLRFLILVGGASLAPLIAFSHACEFLVARLDMKAGSIHLEITADYGGNPLIEDEAAAREAVKRILQVHAGGQVWALEDLAPLNIQHRTQWDPQTPASFAPPQNGQDHQLLSAVWEWQPKVDELTLAVPKGHLHDVLLWTQDEHLPGKQAKWMLLIEGESTPVIHIPHTGPKGWIISLVAVVGLGLFLAGKRPRRQRIPV